MNLLARAGENISDAVRIFHLKSRLRMVRHPVMRKLGFVAYDMLDGVYRPKNGVRPKERAAGFKHPSVEHTMFQISVWSSRMIRSASEGCSPVSAMVNWNGRKESRNLRHSIGSRPVRDVTVGCASTATTQASAALMDSAAP